MFVEQKEVGVRGGSGRGDLSCTNLGGPPAMPSIRPMLGGGGGGGAGGRSECAGHRYSLRTGRVGVGDDG